jgi:hypothetical protein
LKVIEVADKWKRLRSYFRNGMVKGTRLSVLNEMQGGA